jgi:PAS domain S-box-containing protein
MLISCDCNRLFCGREFLIYYRDPLLDKICDRILDLPMPAFIKNSELVFVAVNDAFANLFNVQVSDLVGTSGDTAELEALLDIEDKERACLVFGEEQYAAFADPFGKGRFRVEMERFTLADGQTFLYCIFGDQLSGTAPHSSQPMTTPKGMRQPLALPANRISGAGKLSGELAEHVIESLVGGVCIYDENDRLIYFNEKLQEFYGPLIGDLQLGMSLREVLTKLADDWIGTHPDDPEINDRTRDTWINDRIEGQRVSHSVDLMPLSDGRWLQCINRRLANGIFIGLRIEVTDMKRDESLLKRHIEEAGLYRELLDRLPVAAFARGPDQKLAFVNQAYANLFGRSFDELVGMSEAELLGDYAEAVSQANNETLINGTEFEREEETPVAGGRIASTIVKTGRLITENGMPYVVGTVVDISPIRQREILLQEANSKAESIRQDFENIVASIDVGVIVLDGDLKIQLVNEAYLRQVWDKSAEHWNGDLVGRSFEDLLRNYYHEGNEPEGFLDIESYCRTRLEEVRSGVVQTREVLSPDGTVTLYSGIKLSGGKFLLCYVDVTELRKRDSEVAKAHEMADRAYRLVRNATDTMPEGLMVIEGEHIVFANPSLATVINIPEELLVAGGRWEDVFRATSLQNAMNDETSIGDGVARFREAMLTKKDVSYNFPLDDERWVHLEMRSRDDGQSVILCSDQTTTMRREAELKRLIARAEAADRAKSEFLGNMSLEIRTPMNGILGIAELLAKSGLDTRQKAFIDIIMKSGNALLTIINDILDFSKLDAGHMQLKYAPFDPCEALEDVASLFASKAQEKDIELLVKRSGDIPAMIMGDAGRFRQIITNLLGNAVKFTEQGFVSASIGTSSDGSGKTILHVVVEDSGVGIPADKLRTIFEKFSQMEMGSNRRDGSGLGLAIAQRLAGIQGGVISVHSSEGKGSTFTFMLPVQVAVAQHKPNSLPANVEGARVLIVDDHDLARGHLLEHAAEWGFECVGAADAVTGLLILDAAAESGVSVDAVLIDAQMPDIDGAEMARRVRSDPRFDGLAVILMTSQDIANYEKTVSNIRVEAYLTKPIRSGLLRNTLLDVVRASRSHTLVSRRNVVESRALQDVDALERELPRPPMSADRASPDTREPDRQYVLVAEDNEVNQIFFSQILEAAGMAYRIAENGEAVVAAWQQATPAIILMDTTLPVLDGFEATRMIRSIEAITGQHTPIIGVISHAHHGDSEQCIAAGMDDYITKPVSPERLEEKILNWAGHALRPLADGLYLA